jgi:hypothetical protein
VMTVGPLLPWRSRAAPICCSVTRWLAQTPARGGDAVGAGLALGVGVSAVVGAGEAVSVSVGEGGGVTASSGGLADIVAVGGLLAGALGTGPVVGLGGSEPQAARRLTSSRLSVARDMRTTDCTEHR